LAGERNVDDRERRHRALVRQLDELVGGLAGRRIGLARREVHLPVPTSAGPQRLALLEPTQERALGKRRGVLDLDAGRNHQDLHWVTVVGFALGFGALAQFEVRDIDDRADRLVDPVRMYPGAGAHRVGIPSVDRVKKRGIGAVEL
jgi:hypothetical protein